MAAKASQAAFAGNEPEGRCARGPSARSANTWPAEQRWHRPVPQQVHVIDAVRPGGHPGDEAGHLQVGIDPARTGDPHILNGQVRQVGP